MRTLAVIAMTKRFTLIILFGLVSCQEKRTAVEDNRPSIEVQNRISDEHIDDIVDPITLPEGFQMSTNRQVDNARNLTISVSIPISGIEEIDGIVIKDLENLRSEFLKGLDKRIKEDSSMLTAINSHFQAHPVSVYADSRVKSFLFFVSYYHAGAAHPMTMYHSFNFDNKSHKRMYFKDYFEVNSKRDTTLLENRITAAIGRNGIEVTDLKDVDFNIEKDTISFNFDDYEIASYVEGVIRGRVSRTGMKDIVKATYR